MTEPQITQHNLPRKDVLMLARLLRPGDDFILLGAWDYPQIIMDLSKDELAAGLHMLALLRPAIDASTEGELINALICKVQLAATQG